MSLYTLAWVIWAAAFLVIEGIALADRRLGDTLSEHVWKVFKVRDRRPTAATWAVRVPLYVFLVWLSGHLAFGWWTL